MKLWKGRFAKELNDAVNDFNASIRFDKRLYREDITGSLAHADMLCKQGIISPEDNAEIQAGLCGILADLETGTIKVDETQEDIHSFVESELTARIGEGGKRLHTARSRNDQVAVDTKMHVRSEIGEILTRLTKLVEILLRKARENVDAVMPGYTHMQRAQPVSFGHHISAYAAMFLRDCFRLTQCRNGMGECPLGSAALAGTTHPIDRAQTASVLGFRTPSFNSMDGVSDRDYCMELLSDLSIVMTHLSRFSEEIILWCSWEFKFLELDDAYATGSSIMPQKKNPDIAELVRGKTGRVFGNMVGMFTVMKGLPLAYNKDMQEDKEGVFDSIDTVKACLEIFTEMVATATINRENMKKAAAKGFINATDCADYLVRKGMPFRTAYRLTGELVARCIEKGCGLDELSLEEYRKFSPLFEKDVYEEISLDTCLNKRNSFGGPAPEALLQSVKLMEGELKKYIS